MNEARADQASQLLYNHWMAGTKLEALPENIRPRDRREGYAVQARLAQRTTSSLFGWKIAGTNVAGQRHINVDGPLAGRIFANRVRDEADVMSLEGNGMKLAEVEFAFRMARDLSPREDPYSVDEVLAAAGTLHPAVEVPDSRFENYVTSGMAQLIADNACGHYFVLGKASPDTWRTMDLAAHPVSATVTSGASYDGAGANVLGDPRIALAWLANELSGLGVPLHAGEVVTTGTCMLPIPVLPGDRVDADFGVLGTISARFGA